MKSFCLRLAIFLVLGIPLVFLLPQKALAKDSYGLTWTVAATPSAVVVDSADNIYYAGFVASGSADLNPLPTHLPAPDIKTATSGGIFLTKINSDYTYGYSYLIEADDPLIVNDKATSISLTKIATDSANNVFLLGSFNGNVNFNSTAAGAMDFHSSNGQTWQFLTEIKADGTYGQTVFWQSPYFALRDIAFDQSNNIYLGGMVTNTTAGDITINLDILTGAEVPQTLNPGDTMVFYTSLVPGNPDVYDYSIFFKNTGSNHLELDHIALDSHADPHVFLFGAFTGSNVNFDGAGGTDNKTSNGANDLYVSQYYSNGLYQDTYTIGGTGNESAGALVIDKNDNVYYSGGLGTKDDVVQLDPIGATDSRTVDVTGQNFLTKLTDDGTTYGYTVSWQTNGLNVNKIAFDSINLIYLVGISAGTIDYDPTAGIDNIAGFGGNDAFLTVLNSDGTYNYSYVWGGTEDEKALDAAFDSYYLNDLYIAGSTKSLSLDFDPTDASDIMTDFSGGENGYITQFSSIPYVPPTPTPTGAPSQNNNSNSSSSNPGPATCTSPSPSAPSIFQIWATKDKATIHFVPSRDQQNSYAISYGPYSDSETYNVTFDYSDKSGAIPYAINALNPGTVYYFKVRANNGCMPGTWSNILSLRTAYSVGSTSKAYLYNSRVSVANGNLGGSCSEYTVLSGDSFWSIAQKLLGAGGKYFQLWNANKARFPSLNYSSIIRTGWFLSVGC